MVFRYVLAPSSQLRDLLLKVDRPEDAPTAYEHSLDISPARYNSLLGAARAASHYRTLLETVDWEKA